MTTAPVTVDAFIAGLPKCELHLHIEGTLEPGLKFALAQRNGIELPYADEAALRAAYDFHDLPGFLSVYYEGMSVLRTEQDFYDLAAAYAAKAHSQNVRYAEIFFDPQAHTARGVAFDTVIRGLTRALDDAERDTGFKGRLVMCFLRDFQAEFAMATLVQALGYQEWIIGVGLDSDEAGNPPVKFREVFARARAEGFRLTMHCDVDQKNSTEHIRQVIEEIGVDRIDHGVNALEDPSLIERIRARGLGLTVCPISNAQVTDGMKAAEIRALLDQDVKVTVNSDDPAYFPGYVAENLAALREPAALSDADLVRLQRNAIEISWAAPAVREEFLAELTAYAKRAAV
ncbi:adenosine deaminase [Streptomyces sp. NPDC052051]|uniref:adenosine deaminase n=1 Tax=Streptomyces sp. NPDC052051 TaxID=3154649 RepID=UPI0034364E1A